MTKYKNISKSLNIVLKSICIFIVSAFIISCNNEDNPKETRLEVDYAILQAQDLRLTKELNVKSCDLKITSNILAELIKLIDDNKISTTVGKEVFEEMFKTGNSPIKIVEEKGLSQISDTSELTSIIENILDTNPKSIEDFKLGKSKAAGFLMG